MFENIIFGILIVAALGAAVFTCIYEAGGFMGKSDKEQTKTQSDNDKSR